MMLIKLIYDLQDKKIITKQEAEAINKYKIYNFTKTNIWKDMTEAKEIEREKPFYINIPASKIYEDESLSENILVQGIIDLYYINKNNEIVLVDYKTDFVEDRNESILIDKYKIQIDLYKEALESALGRSVDKVYIYSTYLDKEIEII